MLELGLTGLPTNNLDTEHDFSKFSCLSDIARFLNRTFSAKGIGNDMTLFKFKKRRSAKYNQENCKCFKHRKKQWNEKQKVCNPYQRKNAESCETERLCQKAP